MALIDGVYSGATVLLRLAGGYAADRISRRKAVAGVGYATVGAGQARPARRRVLGAGARRRHHRRPGGQRSAHGTTRRAHHTVHARQRAGAGLRGAPDDGHDRRLRGPARGARRHHARRRRSATTRCSSRASASPLSAWWCSCSSCGTIGAACVSPPRTVSPRLALRLVRQAPIRRVLAVACLLGLSTIGDGFIYLLLQRREGLSLGWFPLFAVGTSLAYLLMAYPLGALADRVGRRPVILVGFLSLSSAYVLMLSPLRRLAAIVAVLVCLGAVLRRHRRRADGAGRSAAAASRCAPPVWPWCSPARLWPTSSRPSCLD